MSREQAPATEASARYQRYRASRRAGFNRRRYERVMSLVGLQPTDRILDLGCGRGRKSLAYYNHTNPIVGIDRFPPERLAPLGENFRYERRDVTDLGVFDDGSFDVVISFGLLEHLSDEQVTVVATESRRLGDRFAHVVPHRIAFVEPHARMPLFGLWPAALRSLYTRMVSRGKKREYWQQLSWRSDSDWRRLFGAPPVSITNHWYGPLLLYYIVHGRASGPQPEAASD